jgi:hypothetical protein
VWALALSETHLVSASLNADLVVRSFHPADLELEQRAGRRLSAGDLAAEGDGFPLLVLDPHQQLDDSDDDPELDSAYDSGSDSGRSESEGDESESGEEEAGLGSGSSDDDSEAEDA